MTIAILAVAASAVSVAGGRSPVAAGRLSVAAAAPKPVLVAAPTPPPTPVPAIRPLRIELPALGVTAPIVPVGIEADGSMGTPTNAADVAWWDGVLTGEGNALFAGHRDYKRRPGSFIRLGESKPGDVVRVTGDNGTLEFRVEWVRQVPGDFAAETLLGDAGQPVVTLVTCAGKFDRRVGHYPDRFVVRATLA